MISLFRRNKLKSKSQQTLPKEHTFNSTNLNIINLKNVDSLKTRRKNVRRKKENKKMFTETNNIGIHRIRIEVI